MNSIVSITLNNVASSMTAKDVTDILYREGILTVSKITLFHTYKSSNYKTAFIEIGEWHDTEKAYKTIEKLNSYLSPVTLIEASGYDFEAYKAEGRTYDAEIIREEDLAPNPKCEALDALLESRMTEDYEDWLHDYENSSLYDDLIRPNIATCVF